MLPGSNLLRQHGKIAGVDRFSPPPRRLRGGGGVLSRGYDVMDWLVGGGTSSWMAGQLQVDRGGWS